MIITGTAILTVVGGYFPFPNATPNCLAYVIVPLDL